MASNLKNLLDRFVRFTGVGAVGTIGHYCTLYVLVDLFGVDVVVSSSAGFIIGGIINYFLNYRFTFRSQQPHTSAAPKFLTIALIGFFLNGFVMSLLVVNAEIHYLISQIVATGLILVWNFLANQYWTFSDSTQRGD